KFKAHGFTTSGYARDEMEALCHAVALVPESALATIDGVTFKRASAHATNPAVRGEYDEAAHTVTLFDRAFTISVKIDTSTKEVPMGDLGARNVAADGTRSDESVRLIAHEIGHAIDYAPMRSRARCRDARARRRGTRASRTRASPALHPPEAQPRRCRRRRPPPGRSAPGARSTCDRGHTRTRRRGSPRRRRSRFACARRAENSASPAIKAP
ncbi:MAG TPA: hypothetical protein VM261_13275, partial [Kofleriaceae bacterium]|nr:hypothetical protein [Kofleriaceae bacterium]